MDYRLEREKVAEGFGAVSVEAVPDDRTVAKIQTAEKRAASCFFANILKPWTLCGKEKHA